jgi:hypothetical protein
MKWQVVPDGDLGVYARSFRKAAEKMMRGLDLEANPLATFDSCPAMSMYRHAVELQMKALILGKGGNFLKTKSDSLSVYKTRSISWLAQFVSKIVTAVGWEGEFRCEGIQSRRGGA